jgi:murein DD-endopeptidase MepM/ murein hydrolase activator NlpD
MFLTKKIGLIGLIGLIGSIGLISPITFADSPDELRQAIDEKSKELREINSQIEGARKNLVETEEKSNTLNQVIKQTTNSIKQLNLGIRGTEINIEKLKLELKMLDYDISNKEERINLKKEAIIKLLQDLQEKNREGTLIILLKNKSLAESISEIQSITDFNDGLSSEISELEELKNDSKDKFNQSLNKKERIEKENKNLKYKKSIAEDQKKEHQDLLKLNKQNEKILRQRVEELEKQQAEIIEEIEKIEEELRKQIDPSALPTARPGVLGNPVEGNLRITQGYGATSFAQKVYSGKFHNGIDIGMAVGTPILAAEDGEVLAVGDTDRYCPSVWHGKKRFTGSYGKYILIKHNNNLSTAYSHLSRQIVRVGDIVKRGDIIGYSGNTGRSTGPHLHFTVYANIMSGGNKFLSPEIRQSRNCGPQPYGASLNPLGYLQY